MSNNGPGALKKLEVSGRRLLHRIVESGARSRGILDSVPPEGELTRILLLRQDRIGDMIMTLPLLRRLREVHPDARIGIVASESNRIVLSHEPSLDIFTYRKDPSGFTESLLETREFSPDAAVDMHMHDSTTSFIYSMVSGARWRIHVDRENRLPFNVRVKAPQDGHIMEAFSGLLSGLGREICLEGLSREINLSLEEECFADEFWARTGCRPGDCVAVNISAGGANRRWAVERYAAVCSRVADIGLKPMLLYSPSDLIKAEAVHRQGQEVLLSPVTPDILHLAALLKGVNLLISPDTSVVHIAASFGIPVVGMYLPFDSSLPCWYPWGVRSEILMSSDHESLDSVSPEIVSAAAERLVSDQLISMR